MEIVVDRKNLSARSPLFSLVKWDAGEIFMYTGVLYRFVGQGNLKKNNSKVREFWKCKKKSVKFEKNSDENSQ